MNHFQYKNGILSAEDIPLTEIADAIGTPFYCYSTATLTRHYKVFAAALPKGSLVAFSVKANGNIAVLKTLAQLGSGADVVSGGELKKALAAGIPANRIVFSGVGKTHEEMRLALDAGIYQFNVEGEPELEALSEVAVSMGKTAPITIRVNPDVDAKTHAKITTGTYETKFGIPWPRAKGIYAKAAKLPGLEIVGVDVHIGSQITDLDPFRAAFARVAELIAALRRDGHRILRADLGGGLGVPYRLDNTPPPDPDAYGEVIAAATRGLDVQLILEPGRLIAANAGILVTRVIYTKPGESKTFLVVDAGMNDLIRPALYDAHHDILPIVAPDPKTPNRRYDVVGPVCETADTFGRDRDLPEVQGNDLMAIMTAGAYGAVMASAYNARPPAAEVLVNGREWCVVRPRMTLEALIALERVPGWLEH
ncbi:MAG TPA: diaminopimelate decarboxylase [Micropepsaceae bacterium]|nr:diaminopimelate decarboxylase [Micropepsaceae bacterium]